MGEESMSGILIVMRESALRLRGGKGGGRNFSVRGIPTKGTPFDDLFPPRGLSLHYRYYHPRVFNRTPFPGFASIDRSIDGSEFANFVPRHFDDDCPTQSRLERYFSTSEKKKGEEMGFINRGKDCNPLRIKKKKNPPLSLD